MNFFDVTAPIYEALEITVGYFVASGDDPMVAHNRTMDHIVRSFNEGERRPLALANRAIGEAEREQLSRTAEPDGMYDGAA